MNPEPDANGCKCVSEMTLTPSERSRFQLCLLDSPSSPVVSIGDTGEVPIEGEGEGEREDVDLKSAAVENAELCR